MQPGDIRADAARAPARPRAEPFAEVLADLDRVVVPGLTHWQHPNFFAYFPGNSSYAAILGELAAAGPRRAGHELGHQPGLHRGRDADDGLDGRAARPARVASAAPAPPAAASSTARRARPRWRRSSPLAGGPPAARSTPSGDTTHLVAYATIQAHSSIEKGLRIAGIGTSQLRIVPHDEQFAMRPDELERLVAADRRRRPHAVLGVLQPRHDQLDGVRPDAGDRHRSPTTNGMWLHVDAAMSGIAALAPEFRWVNDGLDQADSYCTNPHKWMGVNFDCDLFYTADRAALLGRAQHPARVPALEGGRVRRGRSTTATGRSRSVAGSAR